MKFLNLLSYLKNWIVSFTVLFFGLGSTNAQITAPAGSYIIKMDENLSNSKGLKPYGMIHELVKFYHIPMKWVVKSGKAKDAVDYTINGVNYSGGLFVIYPQFVTPQVASAINGWKTGSPASPNGYTRGGVVVNQIPSDYTFSGANSTDINSVPVWTLDDQNGKIAEEFIKAAGIPSSQYNWKDPQLLAGCDDIFVMPHADPTWATHSNLYDWNET